MIRFFASDRTGSKGVAATGLGRSALFRRTRSKAATPLHSPSTPKKSPQFRLQGSCQMSSLQPLYGTEKWRRLARHQRRIEPLCRFCKQRGINTPATQADHIVPHNGDRNAFFTGELQSLCDACHHRVKQSAETLGFRLDVGTDGWPIDPLHPANRKRPSLTLVPKD